MGTALFAPPIVEIVLKAAELIKARGGTISFDPNLRTEMLNLPGLQGVLDLRTQFGFTLPMGTELARYYDSAVSSQ